jgi:transposase-like protein
MYNIIGYDMSQHFLLSPAAKTLSLAKVMRMTDEAAREAFRKVRWSETNGAPVCPECGCTESYDLKSRNVYKCKACYKQFSITSGTIFHSRKLAIRDILAAIAVFVNGAKGYSALQLSRDLSVDYKTAFVMLHKVREAIQIARQEGALSGNVEVDGAYFGGYVKPANEVADRKDRRKKANQSGKRQVVVVIREREGHTITHVTQTEAEGVALSPQMYPRAPPFMPMKRAIGTSWRHISR